MLSVVMSVYNGARRLRETLDSILVQTEPDFELIVVDDGSTDATPAILAEESDRRLRVITQPNAGLTQALRRGCAEVRSAIIARHDCGDRSHPKRFERQLSLLQSDPSIALVSCGTSFLAPNGEVMYVSQDDGNAIRDSLLHDPAERIRGLSHHGSAMFRRDAYLATGGYRRQFYFAQDLDLWVRLAQQGAIAFVPDVLYEARFDSGTISWTSRDEQVELTRLIVAIRDHPDQAEELLLRAAPVRRKQRRRSRAQEARALYFIASCLRRQRNANWRSYARQAVAENPFLMRAWLLFLRGLGA
jgi:glycosyltransferase involved in cell wall biosynthesis